MSLIRNDDVSHAFAADGVYTASDRILNKNIKPLTEILPSIKALSSRKYDYLSTRTTSKESIGFFVQDVNKQIVNYK